MELAKPRIGLTMLAGEWFWKYKMFGDNFLDFVKKEAEHIYAKMSDYAETVGNTVVLNQEQAKNLIRDINSSGVDLIVICPLIWTSDLPFIEVLKETPKNMPIILLFYNPYEKLPAQLNVSELIMATNPVGALQFSNALRRYRKDFVTLVYTKDSDFVFKEIYEYAKAARILKDLKNMKIALLPSECPDISNTWCDDFKISSRIGPRIVRIPISELYKIAESIADKEVDLFINELKASYEVLVSQKSLVESARASLGLAKLFEKYGFDALAIQDLDDEMHKLLKTRPCLYVHSIFKKNRVVGMEGDVHTTLAMLILRKITDQPILFAEPFTFDKAENIMIMGHMGMLDVEAAKDPKKVKVIPDVEYKNFDEVEGAYMYFIAKEGPVTLFSLIDEGDNYRFIVGKGEAVSRDREKIEGYSHILVRPNMPVEDFLKKASEAGAGQHWAITYGDHVSILKKLADFMGVNITLIG